MQNDLQRAFLSYQRGDRQQAGQLARRILKKHPRSVDAMHLLGMMERDRGALDKAQGWLRRALDIAPRNEHLLNSAGLVEQELGNYSRSESLFRQSMAAAPGYVQARYNLAQLFDSLREHGKAGSLYRQLLAQQPDHVDALANLSAILEAEHQLDEASSLAQKALKQDPNHFIARLTLANIATRNSSFGEVITLLGPLIKAGKLSPVNHAVAVGKCAFALEKQGDFETAFSFYEAANQVLHRAFAPRMQSLESLYAPDAVERIGDAAAEFRPEPASGHTESPVFLIGFPRSGTTLLDQILTSHSRITVLEERENLIDAYTRFPATDTGLRELQQADDAVLGQLRKHYWERVGEELGIDVSGQLIIDKQPLNAIALLHIARLFPGAKVLVALRDPRDCVFSCFQQRFGMSQAMFQFLQLETAVSYYGKVMNIVTAVRDNGALPMHFVRYERVISDFRDEVGKMIDFLGLEWEESLEDYRSTARSRHISTPSASQVIQPLYTSSIGKWRNFQPWIGSSFGPLEPWAKEWGYPA